MESLIDDFVNFFCAIVRFLVLEKCLFHFLFLFAFIPALNSISSKLIHEAIRTLSPQFLVIMNWSHFTSDEGKLC